MEVRKNNSTRLPHSAGETQVMGVPAASAGEAKGMATEVEEEAAETVIANKKHRMLLKDRVNMKISLKIIQLPLIKP